MKKLYSFFVLVNIVSNLFAQSDFFYSKEGKEQTFKIREDIVIFKTNSQNASNQKLLSPKFKSANIIYDNLMKAKVDPKEFGEKDISGIDNIMDWYYMLQYVNDGTLQALCNQIFVRPKTGESIEKIIQKSELSDKVEKMELFVPESDIYLLELDCKMKDILSICRQVYKTGMVDFSEPNFYKEAQLGNTFWPNQWNLKNTGQENGTPGIDINVEPAWNTTRGSSNIKIAIIDEGVDLTHPDLQANLLSGFDATGNGSGGSYTGNDDHGTSCAGIIGAINNSIGVVGIASGSKMIPIRAFINTSATNAHIISAFRYARNNGADVISNSWAGGSPSDAMKNVIDSCVNFGRNGKGCVVVFCSHNDNGNVRYPADLPNVIAVGAITSVGRRASTSNYGNALDVVAPVIGNSTLVYTTDLQGSLGANTANGTAGDYRSDFRGTSAACPQVAGIAALILSVNPNLTSQEVRNIIEMTTKKLEGYSYQTISGRSNGAWNNETGYGLVDAHAAVQAATCTSSLYSQTISTNRFIRSCNNSFSVQNATISNNAKLTIKSNETTINGTFEMKSGSQFEIR